MAEKAAADASAAEKEEQSAKAAAESSQKAVYRHDMEVQQETTASEHAEKNQVKAFTDKEKKIANKEEKVAKSKLSEIESKEKDVKAKNSVPRCPRRSQGTASARRSPS